MDTYGKLLKAYVKIKQPIEGDILEMKKILVALILILAMFLTACGTTVEDTVREINPEAYAMYVNAIQSLEEATALDVDVQMIMMVEGAFNQQVMGSVTKIAHSETEVDMGIDVTVSMFGEFNRIEAFLTDGILYTEIEGEIIEQPMTVEEAMQQASVTSPFVIFPEEAILSASIDGGTIPDLELDLGEEFEGDFSILASDIRLEFELDVDALGDIRAAFAESFSDLQGAQITLDEVSVAAVVSAADERLLQTEVVATATLLYGGQESEIRYIFAMIVNSMDEEEVEINFPTFITGEPEEPNYGNGEEPEPNE